MMIKADKQLSGIFTRSPGIENQYYDATLLWCITGKCNFDCVYCCYNQKYINMFHLFIQKTKIALKLDMSILIRFFIFRCLEKKLPLIDVPALMTSLDKAEKIFRIAFTGGEPFLVPNIIEACIAIAKNHFISFNTNLTTDNIKQFGERIDPRRVVGISASLHIKELERHKLLNKYIDNFIECKRKGFNISAILVAYPHLFNEIGKYKKFFQEKGITVKCKPFRGQYNKKSYPESYTLEELQAFDLDYLCRDMYTFDVPGRICNAGYNIAVVLKEGFIFPCYNLYREIGHIYKKIEFKDKLINCPFRLCKCRLDLCDPYLFEKALLKPQLDA